MSATARAELETLLRARKLDNTLTSVLPLPVPDPETSVVPTGLPALDDLLHGGIPRGQVSEIVGTRSSGRTSALLSLLAAATARGEVVALVDTLDRLDPASAAEAGVDLLRVLWVRGEDVPVHRSSSLLDRALNRAVKAVNLVLQAGGFSVVALDLADIPPQAASRLPFTTWPRLQRTIEGSLTACVILAGAPLSRSAGGVTVRLQSARPSRIASFHDAVRASRTPFLGGPGPSGPAGAWAGDGPRARRLRGLPVEAGLARAHARAQTMRTVRMECRVQSAEHL